MIIRFLKKYGCWLFLAAMIALTVYMNVYLAFNVLDSDTSEDVYHGWIIAQQKNPLTGDVYFSTELRLLDIATAFSVFFAFTGDWTLVRILGAIAMQAYFVLSFVYLCRQAGMRRPWTVWAAGALLIPFSTPYARVILYHLYYILYQANAFWMLGLTLRLLKNPRRAVLPALLLGGLWLFVGLNGIRHMLILGLPMLLYAAIRYLQMMDTQRWQADTPLCRQPFWKTPETRLCVILILSFICFGVGFVINKLVLLPHFGVTDMSEITYRPRVSIDRYLNIVHGWLIAIGVRNSTMQLIGLRGLALAAALFAFTYALILSFRAMKQPELSGRNCLKSMLALSFVTTTFIFLFDSTDRIFEQYYIPVCVWAVATLVMELEESLRQNETLCRRLLALAACACMLFQGAYTVLYLRFDQNTMDRWECLYFDRFDAVEKSEDCVAFMQENGYTHAMTDYWYANVMMEIADGEVTVAPMLVNYNKDPSIYLQKWGTSRSAFLVENLPDSILVFFEKYRTAEFEQNYPHAPRVYEGDTFFAYELAREELIENRK